VAENLAKNEEAIVKEMNEVQGKPVDIKGYYFADDSLAKSVMRPSQTFNQVIDAI